MDPVTGVGQRPYGDGSHIHRPFGSGQILFVRGGESIKAAMARGEFHRP